MKQPYKKGVASHLGPESCAGARKDIGEALTGGHAGRAIEPRNQRSGVPTLSRLRKAIPLAVLSRAARGPRAVKEPGHVRNLHAREPGEPVPARLADHRAGRSGNAEAVILR